MTIQSQNGTVQNLVYYFTHTENKTQHLNNAIRIERAFKIPHKIISY